MNKRTKKYKEIKDSWLKGLPLHKDLDTLVHRVRLHLRGWSEKKVRGVWDELYIVFQSWKNKHGIQEKKAFGPHDELDEILSQIELDPWMYGSYGISDSFDLYIYLRNTEYKELKPLLEKYSDFKLLAVITLKEASMPYPSLGERNLHVLAALKAEREMTVNSSVNIMRKIYDGARPLLKEKKQKKELLDAGRALGSLSNKEKADKRHKGLYVAAIYHFKNNPGSNYNGCIDWMLNAPGLQPCILYGDKKKLSCSAIRKIITGAKNEALESLSS